MKTKLFLIGTLLALSLGAFGQGKVAVYSERIGFFTVDGDTMQITRLDQTIAMAVVVPEGETDSVTVTGCTFTVDGIATNGIKIAPGKESVNLGFKLNYLDSINVACPGKAYLVILKDRDKKDE